MTVIISDDFNGMTSGEDIGGRTPSPTNTPGNTWNQTSANTVESDGSNQIKMAAQNDNAWIDTGETDFRVDVDFNPGGVNNRMSVMARSSGDTQDVGADNYNHNFRTSADEILVRKTVNGAATTLGSAVSFTINASTTYKVGIEVNGTGIEIFIDDVSKATRTDSAVNGTTVGGSFTNIEHNAFADAAARFDNFLVDDLAAPPAGARPQGPFGHPFHGPFAGPIG